MGVEVTQHGGGGTGDAGAPEPERAAFYYDFASPEAYLASERVIGLLPFAAEWVPIRSPRAWDDGFRCAEEADIARLEIERVAASRQLQSLRWPPPFDSELALRAATFAKQIGRVVAFSLAAFRQAYAGGADLADTDVVLIAASACEMHPRAVLAALERDAIGRALDEATELALARGVTDVPAVWIPDGRVIAGDAALDGAG
jgi:2-hydroxychromene-2-carboxylate isomerase